MHHASRFLGSKGPVIFETPGGRDAAQVPRSPAYRMCKERPGECPSIDLNPDRLFRNATSRDYAERIARVLVKERLLKEYGDMPGMVVTTGSAAFQDQRTVKFADIVTGKAFENEYRPDPEPKGEKPLPAWRQQATRMADEMMYMWGPHILGTMPKLMRELNPPAPAVRNLYTRNNNATFLALNIGHQGQGLSWHKHVTVMNYVVHGAKEWLLTKHFPAGGMHTEMPSRMWFRDVWPKTSSEQRERLGMYHCTAGPGDILYVPSGFYHTTRNYGTVVALALFFKDEAELEEAHQVQEYWEDGMPKRFTHKAQVESAMDSIRRNWSHVHFEDDRGDWHRMVDFDGDIHPKMIEEKYRLNITTNSLGSVASKAWIAERTKLEVAWAMAKNEGAHSSVEDVQMEVLGYNTTEMNELFNDVFRQYPEDAHFLFKHCEWQIEVAKSMISADAPEAESMGSFRDAISSCKRALMLNSLCQDCHHQLSLAYAALNDPETSIVHGEKALAMKRNDALMCRGIVESLKLLGREDAASKKLDECIDRSKAMVERGFELSHFGPARPVYKMKVWNKSFKSLANFLALKDTDDGTEAATWGDHYADEEKNELWRMDLANEVASFHTVRDIFGSSRGYTTWHKKLPKGYSAND